MIRQTPYEPGTPSYADLASPDLDASLAFYGALFGWTAEASTEPEAMGYTVFKLGDAAVAGLGPTFGDMPPHWNTYVTVANVDAAVATAAAAGGQVMAEPFDVFDAGRMAVIADPGGAALSLWQSRDHIGAEVRMEPNTLCWHELNTRDPEAATAFLGTLFGWEARPVGAPGMDYTELRLGETGVAGLIVMDENWPADVPSHWMVYFAVSDCGAAAARVAELGGEVHVPPTDIPGVGQFSVVADPHGAVFSVIALNDTTS
ncbi:MAG: VOC family protein [Acidimicrobiia bacterium]|nr:VOC family protein [Acidimicrobiia bacterium]MYC46430.1 VOC family protein [Acidimicrobiia bacterium]MYI18874.1 VOC family protein [Acidimicrobiia bacterium]